MTNEKDPLVDDNCKSPIRENQQEGSNGETDPTPVAAETSLESTNSPQTNSTNGLKPTSISPPPCDFVVDLEKESNGIDLAASYVRFQEHDVQHEYEPASMSRHDLLASPTSSRPALVFGSLDIIMDTDKSRVSICETDGVDPNPPKWGWVVVVASWIVMIPVAGVLSSFGTLVSSLTEEFNATKLEAGWIGSLAFGFTVGTCPFSTPLFTVYGARKVSLVGVLGATISLVVTSFTPWLYLMFLTYSAMLGVFANFVYNTAMNLTGQYFPNKHQAVATCLASAGISFGTLLVNPLSNYMVGVIGWRNTLRVMSGLVLVIGLACVAAFKPVKTEEQIVKSKLRKKMENTNTDGAEPSESLIDKTTTSMPKAELEAVTESLQYMHTESRISLAAQEIKKNVLNKGVWDCSVCANPVFILWMLGTLFWSVSFLFPFIFLIDYMQDIGIERSSTSWVMTAYGIAEFAGRLLCAVVTSKIPFSLAYEYAGSAALVGLATIVAPQFKSLGTMFAYAIVAGINAGILNSLMFVTTMQLFGNESGKHVWGYINVMLALGMVVGPVAAGGIYDATQSYVSAFYMGGSLFIVCAIMMLLIPIAKNHFPQPDRETGSVRVSKKAVTPSGSSSTQNKGLEPKKSGSIVKPGSLRRLAQHQNAMKSSKWSGDVEVHLQALQEIDHQVSKENLTNNAEHCESTAPASNSHAASTGQL